MNKLTKKGFVETENDFSQYSASELVRHFHQYGFKDAEGRDLVVSEDFINLIKQFSQAERKQQKSAAQQVIESFDAQELIGVALGMADKGR